MHTLSERHIMLLLIALLTYLPSPEIESAREVDGIVLHTHVGGFPHQKLVMIDDKVVVEISWKPEMLIMANRPIELTWYRHFELWDYHYVIIWDAHANKSMWRTKHFIEHRSTNNSWMAKFGVQL